MKKLFLSLAMLVSLAANAQFTNVAKDINALKDLWTNACTGDDIKLQRVLLYDVDGDGNNEAFMVGDDSRYAAVVENENGDKMPLTEALAEGDNYIYIYDDGIICTINTSPDELTETSTYYQLKESTAFLIGIKEIKYSVPPTVAQDEDTPEPTIACMMIQDGELQTVSDYKFDEVLGPQIAHINITDIDGWVDVKK